MNEGALLAANLFIDNGFGADSDAQGDPLAVSEVAGDPAKVGFPILVTSVDGRHWSDQGRSQREPRLDIER
jgi:hypothetical protein